MTGREERRLTNVLDALDRLFDREVSVLELEALVFATGEALRATPHWDAFDRPAHDLRNIACSRVSPDVQRERALVATDGLRAYLARLLPVE
jgi:hypothetical protein